MFYSLLSKNECCFIVAKPHCHAWELALTELENISSIFFALLSSTTQKKFGIEVIRISDLQVSKKYGIKSFPALIYFRNGNPIIYYGEDSVLKNKFAVKNTPDLYIFICIFFYIHIKECLDLQKISTSSFA